MNRPLNLILSESSQFFCANRPVRFFARIVPVESSQGGTGFCAKRPVTHTYVVHTSLEQNTAQTSAYRNFHRYVSDTPLIRECVTELLGWDFGADCRLHKFMSIVNFYLCFIFCIARRFLIANL